jgi:hypothetical protein
MVKRHHQILAGILAVQIVLSIFVFWPKTATVEREPLFPELETEDVVALAIADTEGNNTQLKKVTGDWVLPDADDYPAQADKITSLLDKIAGLTTGRLVTRTDASHKRLQVAPDEFVRRIDFETAEGTKRTLYLGSSPRYNATHFRLDGQSETYLTSDISTWDTKADAASWVDTAYLSISQDDVTKMTLENTNGTLIFTKDEEDKWTMDGLAADETLDETKVTDSIRQAASVTMLSPLGKEEKASYGMDEPNAVVALETITQTTTLRVGAKDPDDNSYIVTSSESPYYVRVSEYGVKNLVESTGDDFLQAPPTPTPTENTNAP